jgi:ubiquinone/menaquinone biosynthesis C-methylase UbiE
VAGIDGSSTAISLARRRFASENLKGDLQIGNFLELPWKDETFHFGIDRCSITCVGRELQRLAVSEMHRVLMPGGLFFFNCYDKSHTSARTGKKQKDGRIKNIQSGTLQGVGALSFSSQNQVKSLFSKNWSILELEHLVITNKLKPQKEIHAEWRVIAQKI